MRAIYSCVQEIADMLVTLQVTRERMRQTGMSADDLKPLDVAITLLALAYDRYEVNHIDEDERESLS